MTMPLPHVRTCEAVRFEYYPARRHLVFYRRLVPLLTTLFGCCSFVYSYCNAMWCLLSLITTETCTTHAAANNYSWLMEHGPVDWVMRSRGVVETWDFASDQCRELHHQCVARPPSLWTELSLIHI